MQIALVRLSFMRCICSLCFCLLCPNLFFVSFIFVSRSKKLICSRNLTAQPLHLTTAHVCWMQVFRRVVCSLRSRFKASFPRPTHRQHICCPLTPVSVSVSRSYHMAAAKSTAATATATAPSAGTGIKVCTGSLELGWDGTAHALTRYVCTFAAVCLVVFDAG